MGFLKNWLIWKDHQVWLHKHKFRLININQSVLFILELLSQYTYRYIYLTQRRVCVQHSWPADQTETSRKHQQLRNRSWCNRRSGFRGYTWWRTEIMDKSVVIHYDYACNQATRGMPSPKITYTSIGIGYGVDLYMYYLYVPLHDVYCQ